MNEITNWIQNNWYEFGSLFAQFTFLFAGLWFARKILKSMRATQQQFGALLRLSITDGLEERSKESETNHSPASSVVAGSMLSPAMDRPAAPTHSSNSYAAFERPARTDGPSLSDEMSGRSMTSTPMTAEHDSTPYVAAPLTLPDEAHGNRVVQWLKTPMASSSGPSPLRRVVRWLQAPARS